MPKFSQNVAAALAAVAIMLATIVPVVSVPAQDSSTFVLAPQVA